MNTRRKQRVITVVIICSVLALAMTLVLYALRQNINLFYTPSQVISGQAPKNNSFRIGGMVEKGSIKRDDKGLRVLFYITDFKQRVTVEYTGILPDLFRENQGIVAQGRLVGDKLFKADEILAKHDANYMPPEIRATLGGNNDT
jgi:cytochrome c-type biogenesis protein CcmE